MTKLKANKWLIRIVAVLSLSLLILYLVMPHYKVYFDRDNVYVLQKYNQDDIMNIGQVINYKSAGGNSDNVAFYDGVDGNYIKIQVGSADTSNIGYFTYINKQDILYKSIYNIGLFDLFIVFGGIVILTAIGNLIVDLGKKEGVKNG